MPFYSSGCVKDRSKKTHKSRRASVIKAAIKPLPASCVYSALPLRPSIALSSSLCCRKSPVRTPEHTQSMVG